MGTAALGRLWAVLLLLLPVSGLPTEEPTSGEAVASSSPGPCRRCCDSEDPMVLADAAHASSASPSALPYVLPEVRPYINITILKGEDHIGLGLDWPGWRQGGHVGRSLPGPGGGEVRGAGETRTENCLRPFLSFTRCIEYPPCVRIILNSGRECVQTRQRSHVCGASVLVGKADNEQ